MELKKRNAKRIMSIICTMALVVGYVTCIPSFADTEENGANATNTTNVTTPVTNEEPTQPAETAGDDQSNAPETNAGDEPQASTMAEPQVTASGAESQVKASGTMGTFNGSPAEVDEDGNLLVNEINFPDEEIRMIITYNSWGDYYSSDETLSCPGKDGIITLEEARLMTGFSLLASLPQTGPGVKGLEYFTEIRYLNLFKASMTTLDTSKWPKLESLDLAMCINLTKVDLTYNTKLKAFSMCMGTGVKKGDSFAAQVQEIDFSNCKELEEFAIADCPLLTEIDLSNNSNLDHFDIVRCPVKEVDITKNTKLTYVGIMETEITKIDIPSDTQIKDYSLRDNHLATINIPNISNPEVGGEIGPQTIGTLSGTTSADGTKYYIDMSQAVGKANIAKIKSIGEASYDPITGIASFNAKPESLTYYYDTGDPGNATYNRNISDCPQGTMVVVAKVAFAPKGEGGTTPGENPGDANTGENDNNNNNNNNNTRTRTTVVRTVQLAAPTPVAQVDNYTLDTVEPVDDGVTSYNKPAVPDYGKEDGNWSLLSLLLALAAIGMAVAMIIRREDNEKYRKMISMVFAIAIPVVAIVAFLMLNSITAPMVFVNPSTIVLAILGVLQLVNMLIGKGKYDDDDYYDGDTIEPAV